MGGDRSGRLVEGWLGSGAGGRRWKVGDGGGEAVGIADVCMGGDSNVGVCREGKGGGEGRVWRAQGVGCCVQGLWDGDGRDVWQMSGKWKGVHRLVWSVFVGARGGGGA